MNSHVSSILLGVEDMDRSKRFYTEGLGWLAGFADLPERRRWAGVGRRRRVRGTGGGQRRDATGRVHRRLLCVSARTAAG